MLLDLHTHILPGIDDGAKDPGESRALLRMLAEQGVERVCLTPHFYSDRRELADFLAWRARAHREFLEALPAPEGARPCLLLGAEVFLSRILLGYGDLAPLCLGGSRLMLTELPFTPGLSPRVFDILDHLRYDKEVTPVIAHVERYPSVRADPGLVDRLIAAGCKIQVNIGSLRGPLHGRFPMRLLAQGKVDFLGSDCHNTGDRAPGWPAALRLLGKKLPGALRRAEENARLLAQDGPENDEKEPNR